MFKTKSCRPITYYGSEYTADIQRKNGKNQAIHSINRLFEILLEAWCKETAFPSCQKDYDFYNDPTYGQCAITAMLVCDMFGGTIHKVRVSGGGTHYFNKINNHYSRNEEVPREYCGKNADTHKRYRLLVKSVAEQLQKAENV